MLNRLQAIVKYTLTLAVVVLLGVLAVSAQEETRLQITAVDTSQFPTITLSLIAADREGRAVSDLSSLSISEDGKAVTDFQVDSRPVGVDLVFVIDANRTINQRDDGGLTRREKVRDSIIRFATQFMNQAQLDRVSVVVPAGDTGRLLGDGAMRFPNEVINAINFYDPGTLTDTPINSMMTMAINQLAPSEDVHRYRAVVLFSDAGQLERQLDFESLVAQAQANQAAIFVAILGRSADPHEIESARRLYEPTHAFYVHMPDPADTDPVYNTIRSHGSQTEIQYRSSLAESGVHAITVALADAQAQANFELTVEPPSVRVALDNSRPIRRVATAPDTPLAEMAPTRQPVVAQVEWPDGHPRALAAAALLVNGVEQPAADIPVLSADGLLTFEWDISDLDQGLYELVVRVSDELGLQSQSEPLPLIIEVERPEEAVVTGLEEAGSADAVEPADPAAGPIERRSIVQNLGIISIVAGVLAVIFAFFMVILAVVLMRRRAAPAQEVPATQPASQLDHDATQVILPDFVARKTAGAYLEVIENAPDHQGTIPIEGSNVAIGRDSKLAQIVFNDKSVSRLHARIMESHGAYRLYDEGSASGTYLNFERVSLTPQPLADKNDIHIGRVHLRFHLAAAPLQAQSSDATQVMAGPPRQGGAQRAQPPPADEDLSTQPYMPNQPQTPGRSQTPPPPSDEDPDDVSTQPYMPHSPKK